jgi:hypothetical protein
MQMAVGEEEIGTHRAIQNVATRARQQQSEVYDRTFTSYNGLDMCKEYCCRCGVVFCYCSIAGINEDNFKVR